MPIYEFHCRTCDSEFQDLFFSSSFELHDVICPNCQDKNAEKLMSLFSSDSRSERKTAADASCSRRSCPPGCHCH